MSYCCSTSEAAEIPVSFPNITTAVSQHASQPALAYLIVVLTFTIYHTFLTRCFKNFDNVDNSLYSILSVAISIGFSVFIAYRTSFCAQDISPSKNVIPRSHFWTTGTLLELFSRIVIFGSWVCICYFKFYNTPPENHMKILKILRIIFIVAVTIYSLIDTDILQETPHCDISFDTLASIFYWPMFATSLMHIADIQNIQPYKILLVSILPLMVPLIIPKGDDLFWMEMVVSTVVGILIFCATFLITYKVNKGGIQFGNGRQIRGL